MTRQHMTRIAKALAAFHRAEGMSLTTDQFDALVDQMALACGESNPAFDYDRFRAACWNDGTE